MSGDVANTTKIKQIELMQSNLELMPSVPDGLTTVPSGDDSGLACKVAINEYN